MTFEEWAAQFPDAATALQGVLVQTASPDVDGMTESETQQRQRFEIAEQGAYSWRNNVGATPAKTRHRCPHCSLSFEEHQQPVRYGLANDSPQMNKRIKSSDLILAIPRKITPQDVGRTIAQFGAVESKRGDWRYTGNEHETAQMAWLTLINSIGGFACFSNGSVKL